MDGWRRAAVVAAMLGVCGAALGRGAEPPATPPAAERPFASADALLTELERADQGMVSLTADVRYDREFALQGDRQVRFGRLAFVNLPGEAGLSVAEGVKRPRAFAIQFTRLLVGDVVRDEEQVYVFDGRWLIEKRTSERQIVKNEVVPPGRDFDPLRIGSGPLPIPIGQKREDILARYDATLQPAASGLDAAPEDGPEAARNAAASKEFAAGAVQVMLTPRAEVAAREEFKEIRLWYRRTPEGRLVPRMSRTVNRAGDVAVVMLANVEVQEQGGPANPAAKPPAEWFDATGGEGWFVDVRPYRESQPE